jgi:hypothetical protein
MYNRSQQWQEMRRRTETSVGGNPRQDDSGFQRGPRNYGSGGGGDGRRGGHVRPYYPREYGGGNHRGQYRRKRGL